MNLYELKKSLENVGEALGLKDFEIETNCERVEPLITTNAITLHTVESELYDRVMGALLTEQEENIVLRKEIKRLREQLKNMTDGE